MNQRWPKHEDLHTLQKEQIFSSEELELLTQRINEELEYASSDILRTWGKDSRNAQHTDHWRF